MNRILNRSLIIAALGLVLAAKPFGSFAQFQDDNPKPKRPFKDRIFVGGGLQLAFGNVTTIGASPIVGYRVTDKWSVGVGGTYVYYREKFQGFPAYTTSIYGGNVFTRYTVFKNLFAHAEFGVTNWEAPVIDLHGHYLGTRRINSYSLPIGGGYAQPIGGNSFFEILALYDVLYSSSTSFSASPLTFRAGVNIGF